MRSSLVIAVLWLARSSWPAPSPRRRRARPGGDHLRHDIGFRPEGWNGKAGPDLVVRINGEWVEAQSAFKAVPATTR